MGKSTESGFTRLVKEVLDTKDVIGLFSEPAYDFGYPMFSFIGRYAVTSEMEKDGFKYWKISAVTHRKSLITMVYFHPKDEGYDGTYPGFFEDNGVYLFKGLITQRFESTIYLSLRWAYQIPLHEAQMMHKICSLFPSKVIAYFRQVDENMLEKQMDRINFKQPRAARKEVSEKPSEGGLA